MERKQASDLTPQQKGSCQMRIGGFQKLTLLDFPNQMACIVFTPGCNFRCPYCHNAGLVLQREDAGEVSQEEVLAYLKKTPRAVGGCGDHRRRTSAAAGSGEPPRGPQPGISHQAGHQRQLPSTAGRSAAPASWIISPWTSNTPEGYSRAAGIDAVPLLPRIERSVSLLMHGKNTL